MVQLSCVHATVAARREDESFNCRQKAVLLAQIPMRRSPSLCLILAALAFSTLAGCGSPTLDLAGYPDAAHDRLYRDGRLGDDKGLASFDLRKAWRDVTDTGDKAR
jgi:hypothetical protein